MEIKIHRKLSGSFGEYAELPIVFWYSDILENETGK